MSKIRKHLLIALPIAIATVSQCLGASVEEQTTCGPIITLPCWQVIQQTVGQTNQPYMVDILWYNWEDHIPNRGGDEVYMEVTLFEGNVFRILWYEGRLEYCEVVEP